MSVLLKSGLRAPMSTHTPGPWKAEDWGGIHTKIRAGEDDTFVATVTGGIVGQSGPNARLIAAAPDLLAACKDVLRCGALPDSWAEPIRAAIAKAEGAS